MSKGKFKVVQFLEEDIYSLLLGEGWIYSASDDEVEKLEDAICTFKVRICEITGCLPVQDHCRLPEHDYCICCKELRPGQAHGKN